MDISLRTQQLNSLFSYDKKAHLEESRLEIIPFRFTQTIGASEINEFQKELETDKRFPPVIPNLLHLLKKEQSRLPRMTELSTRAVRFP